MEREPPSELTEAFKAAMAFPTGRALGWAPSGEALEGIAREELSFGRVIVDEEGLTAGARLSIVNPARAIFAEWRHARRPFDVAIEPFRADLAATGRLDEEAVGLAVRRDEQIAQAEQAFGQNHRYQQLRERFENAEQRFKRLEQRHGNRAANLSAHSVFYWGALLLLGAAEWLINYDVFRQFTGVVAIAAGATVVMGVLLALSAHGGGLLLKQWSFRFGQDKEIGDRHSSWRLLVLATLSLLVVLGSAAGSRYAVVARQMAENTAPNILGADAAITYDPMRDVVLSLLWNVMAWAAGVFLSYFAHDKDPDYMDATAQWHRASRRYHRFRRPIVDKLRTIEARFAQEKLALEQAAAARSDRVAAERRLLEQVDAHEQSILETLAGVASGAAQSYRAVLAQMASAREGGLAIENGAGGALDPGQFRAQKVVVDMSAIRELV